MKRIRTKLILSLLLITFLPVFPVYYLVKSLLQRSLEVGYNENVEGALQAASELSRELYSKYKQETLRVTKDIAATPAVALVYSAKSQVPESLLTKLGALGEAKLDFFDAEGALVNSAATALVGTFPALYQNVVKPLAAEDSAHMVESVGGPGFVVAFAPVPQAGFVLLTNRRPEAFRQRAELVVKVHQMFKTLDFFEGELTEGFVLSFFAIYVPIALLSVALGIYFSRKITSPLLQLAEGTREVAAGDWDYRVAVTTKDEIGTLGEAFNQMISTLKEKQDQVISLEKMAVWREIARVLAHEIKNPLTPIQLTVQQMKDKYAGDDQEYRKLLDECSEIVSDEIENLRTLVREFSEFARMPQLSFAPADLNDMVQEVRKLYPNDNIDLQLDPALPEFEFDYEKMRRVLINLVQNGLDSIREKGSGDIEITTAKEGGKAILKYSDSGSGIPEDIQQKIFEPYFSTKKSGMGLGLAIVKRIVTEHGGNIFLTSIEGKGTEFTISLPCAAKPQIEK